MSGPSVGSWLGHGSYQLICSLPAKYFIPLSSENECPAATVSQAKLPTGVAPSGSRCASLQIRPAREQESPSPSPRHHWKCLWGVFCRNLSCLRGLPRGLATEGIRLAASAQTLCFVPCAVTGRMRGGISGQEMSPVTWALSVPRWLLQTAEPSPSSPSPPKLHAASPWQSLAWIR